MNRRRISGAVNLAISGMALLAWCDMAISENGGISGAGWGAFRYYTVLSNLLEGAAAFCLGAWKLGHANHWEMHMPIGLNLLWRAAVTSVSLTLMTVLLFLGAVRGYGTMFTGANLYFHLIVPLMAILDCVFLSDPERIRPWRCLTAALPTAAYEVFYVANILINGVNGHGWSSNDWYGFLGRGWKFAPFVAVGMLLAALALSIILSVPAHMRARSRK